MFRPKLGLSYNERKKTDELKNDKQTKKQRKQKMKEIYLSYFY